MLTTTQDNEEISDRVQTGSVRELERCGLNAPALQDRRAISVLLAKVKRGYPRLPWVCEVGCSAASSAAICPIPKLTVRVVV
jgi:hypothetical protein